MTFDQHNAVVQLCARGMELPDDEARSAFLEAWNIAANDTEKAIAAHYVARSQNSVTEKLGWDETALLHALRANTEETRLFLPSLYMNTGKCHEDLGAPKTALQHYTIGEQHAAALPDDGYSNFVRNGIRNGLQRLATQK